jgi:hypothetical protein
MDSGEFPAAGLLLREDEPMAFWDGGLRFLGDPSEGKTERLVRSAQEQDIPVLHLEPGTRIVSSVLPNLISPLDTVPANEVNTLYNRMEIGFPALPEDMRETKRPGLPEDTDEYLSGTLCDPDEEFPVCPDCGMRHPRSDAMLVFTILVIR